MTLLKSIGLATTLILTTAGAALAVDATDAAVAPDADTPPTIRDGYDATLEDFLWRNRLVIVFADSEFDPRFIEQMAYIEEQLHDLEVRDVVVLTDTDPALRAAIRMKLRPRGFMMALIGKDGGVKLRKPLPWDVRELSRSIDKMPMRQREIRERTGSE